MEQLMEQSPKKSQQGKSYYFLTILTPKILSTGPPNGFPRKAKARPQAARGSQAMSVLPLTTKRGSILHNILTSRKKPLDLPQALL